MGFLKPFLLVIIISSGITCYSQDKVKTRTLAIIDTNKTKIEQAFEIYTWITNNITYDVKAFLSGNSEEKPPSEVLKKRKGVCSGYAGLFNEMCQYAGIESYTIDGYSKGADYYKGGGFYRADHAWNAIYIDSLWYLLDLTWGSGYLVKKPKKMDVIKHFLFGIPYVNNKLVFVRAPNNKYFNMSIDSIGFTHLPLDPKWQLREYPYSVEGFEIDSFRTVNYLNYKEELINARGLPPTQQAFIEGINGKKFNKKNDFDAGGGYLMQASEFNDGNIKVDSNNLITFRTHLEYYRKAKDYITRYSKVNDSVFGDRLTFIEKENRFGKKIISTLTRKLDYEKEFFVKNQKQLLRRYEGIIKRNEKYEAKIAKESLLEYGYFKKSKSDRYDSALLALNSKMFQKSIQKTNAYKKETDSLINVSRSAFEKDSLFSIRCLKVKNKFIDDGNVLRSVIETDDNQVVFKFWKVIKSDFNELMGNYKDKAQNLSLIRSQFSRITANLNLIGAEFRDQADLMGKIFRYSGDSVDVVTLIRPMHKLLLESYKEVYGYTKLYEILNDNLVEFNSENYQLRNSIFNEPIRNIKLFVTYSEELHQNETRKYVHEKLVVKSAGGQANIGVRRLEKEISDFQVNLKKQHSKY
jgi:hypothetical protein